jgi:hypothetical protein
VSELLGLLVIVARTGIDYGYGFVLGFTIGAGWTRVMWVVVAIYSLYVWVPVLLSPSWPGDLTYFVSGFSSFAWTVLGVFLLSWGLLTYWGYRLGVRHRERPKDPEVSPAWAPTLEFGVKP